MKKMKIDVITLFPGMFGSPFSESLVKKAVEKGIIKIQLHDLRKFSTNKHNTVDDSPFGGGAGMVLMAEPIFKAVRKAAGRKNKDRKIILLSPQGKPFSQRAAKELARYKHLVFICAHYEGVDERVMDVVDTELSIGDYVLTGGELPAMVVIDAVSRYIPGVVKDKLSVANDSFSSGLLDYPAYTRPAVFRGKKVPDVLLSGNHKNISRWRMQEALRNTALKRPDLLKSAPLSAEQKEILKEIKKNK